MAVLTTIEVEGKDNRVAFRKIVANLVADVNPLLAKLGDELIEVDTGLTYDLVSTAGVFSWKLSAAIPAGAGGMIATFGGEDTLAAGTKIVGPLAGLVITATSRIMVTAKGVPATAIGEKYVSSRVIGASGVANFTVDSRLAATGAIVAADVSDFDYVVFESV